MNHTYFSSLLSTTTQLALRATNYLSFIKNYQPMKTNQRKTNLYESTKSICKSAHLLAVCMLTAAILHLTSLNSFAQSKHPAIDTQSREVPFTLDDRDRAIQMNEKLNSQQKQIDFKFDSLQQQINYQKELFFWGFGIMISLMLFTLGFIIWDRKTVTEPIRENTQSLIQTLREYAKEQPDRKSVV